MVGLSPKARYGVLVAGWLVLTFESAVLIAPAGVLPLVIVDLSISPTLAGLLVSAFFLGQVVASIPAGIALDVRDERTVLGGSVVVLILSGILWWIGALDGQYGLLSVARFGAGVAGIAIVVAGTNTVGRAFSADHQASAVAVYTTGGPAGITLGQFTGPLLSAAFGWGSLLFLFAIGAGVSFGLLSLTTRGIERGSTNAPPPTADELFAVIGDATVWQIGLLLFASMSVFFFLSSWMPSYLTFAFEFDIAESGIVLGLFTVVGILGRTSGGVVSDRLFGRRRRPVALLSFAATAGLVGTLAGVQDATTVFGLLVVSGFVVQLSVGVFYAHIRDVVDQGVEGTAVSVFLLIGTCGALTALVVTGALIERTPGFLAAFGYAVLLALLALPLAWFAPEG